MVLKVVIAGKVFKVFQSEREKEEAKVENGTSWLSSLCYTVYGRRLFTGMCRVDALFFDFLSMSEWLSGQNPRFFTTFAGSLSYCWIILTRFPRTAKRPRGGCASQFPGSGLRRICGSVLKEIEKKINVSFHRLKIGIYWMMKLVSLCPASFFLSSGFSRLWCMALKKRKRKQDRILLIEIGFQFMHKHEREDPIPSA